MTTTLDSAELSQHRKQLLHYALRAVSDRALAEDLVQDTFVAALSTDVPFRGDSSLRTWLVGILRHKIMDAYRARGRAMESLDAPLSADDAGASAVDAIPAENADPAQHLEHKRLWELFGRLLKHMPARTAESFVGADLGGESTDELCGRLAVSRGRLAVMRHRARSVLREGFAQAQAA